MTGPAGYPEYVVVGMNHHTAPVSVRERFAVRTEDLPRTLEAMRARPGVEDAMLIATCNRVEWYLAAVPPAAGVASGMAFFGEGPSDAGNGLCLWSGPEAVRHLFRVTGGLDSMIVGETQILGQVRAAFAAAQAAGTAGPHLDALIRAALAAGRRIRRETGIGDGAPSVPGAAVAHAGRVLGALDGRRVLIIGAGEMGEATVRALVRAGARNVVVANRTHEAARAMAQAVGGTSGRFDRLQDEIHRADIVITSTASPHVLLDAASVEAAVRSRTFPLLLVDIAVPRNVDPACGRLSGVHLVNIDDLLDGKGPVPALRRAEVRRAVHLVEAEVSAFLRARAARSAASLIAAACADVEEIADREWARVERRLQDLSEEDAAVIRGALRRAVRKVLHRPIAALAEAAGDLRAATAAGGGTEETLPE